MEADGADVSGAYSAVGGCNLFVWSSAKSSADTVVFVGGAFAYRVRRIGRTRRLKTGKRTPRVKPGRSDGGCAWLFERSWLFAELCLHCGLLEVTHVFSPYDRGVGAVLPGFPFGV